MNQTALINSVSRSFSLSLLSLPRDQREAVGLSYLLARYADTIADTGSWSLEERLAHLERWENAILQFNPRLWKLSGSLGKFPQAEADLVAEGDVLLQKFVKLSSDQKNYSAEVLKTLIHAMKWDLRTFQNASSSQPILGVRDMASFDWYCFSIAGCVGRFWVQMFNLPSNLELLATSYGRALQRINILRDVKEDLARGRIYLPENLLDVFQLQGSEPWRGKRWPEFLATYIKEARELLLQGAFFCDSIPKSQRRLRFASMMPLLIGFKTLAALECATSWEVRIKISRPEVRRLGMVALVKAIIGLGITSTARKLMK